MRVGALLDCSFPRRAQISPRGRIPNPPRAPRCRSREARRNPAMAKQSKAVLCREWNKPVVVETITVESPKRGEVMVKIGACGVCHSDLLGDQRHDPAAAAGRARPRGGRHDLRTRRGRHRSRDRRHRRRLVGAHLRQVPLLRDGQAAALRRVGQGDAHAARRHQPLQGLEGPDAQPLRRHRRDGRVRRRCTATT